MTRPNEPKPNELHLTRIYDAPVEAVWNAWTIPEETAKWWGPRGFTITSHSKDLRAGGHWRYTMHGPDGVDWPNTTKYHEVETGSKLVYDHGGNETQPPLFRVTVLFSREEGNTTRMEMTMAFASPETAAESRKFIKQAGGEATWDRLAEHLTEAVSGKAIFVYNRSFDAPVETVFDAFTKPDQLVAWSGPEGARMEFLEIDVREGGGSFYSMPAGPGAKMFGRTKYVTVRKPSLLVYSQMFANEKGEVARHPMAPTWPEAMLTTIRFVAEGTASTRVSLSWDPLEANAEELATFVGARAGMTQGWTHMLDGLEGFLGAR